MHRVVKRYIWAVLLAFTLNASAYTAVSAAVVPVDLDPNATPKLINRMTIEMGGVYFYNPNTTVGSLSATKYTAVNASCPASITLGTTDSNNTPIPDQLTYAVKNAGTCSAPSTKNVDVQWSPTAEWTVFGQYQGNVLSTKPDVKTAFKKSSVPGLTVDTYVQDVPASSCPSIIINRGGGDWQFIPVMASGPAEVDTNLQAVLGSTALCRVANGNTGSPTSPDKILNYYGLPGDYGDGKYKNDFRLTNGRDIVTTIALVAVPSNQVGIAGAGPLADIAAAASSAVGTGSGGDQETCNISGIGWLVCPIAKFGAKITDWAYAGAEQLMQIQPISITDTSTTNPIYTIWNSVKNIANIAFIVAFFMVIFSQATSIGISAYGIRKMLPRLIAAAILVNLSYYICAFGVDVSNVVGSSIDGVIKGAYVANSGQQATDPTPWTTLITAALAGVGAYAGISSVLAATGGAAAGTSAIGAAFAMILPFLTIALFAIMTALAVLVARHALIIMLTIVAPLAFVAYILPNTENLFGKWKKAFISMLVFYPLAAILFSGSQVASMVLRDSSGGNEFLRVASLGVLFFPLFGLPFLLKFSGGLLSRIAGTLNNPNKGPFDRLRKRAEGYRDFKRDSAQEKAAEFRRNNPTSWRGRRYGKSVQREDIYKAAQTRNEEARQKYTNSLLAPSDEGGAPVDPKFAAKMAGLGRKDAKLLKSHGEANAVLERYNQQYTQLANATEPRKKILKAAQDAQKRIDDGTAMAGDVEKVERGNRLKAAISAQATSLTGVDGTLAAQRVAEISGEIGDVKLDKAIRIMARGQAVVDEIDAKDIKAQTTLQSNLRLDGAGLKKVLEQEIGTTVVGMTGKSIVVTEAAKAAAGASMISQGRETDTVMAAVSKIQDPGIRSFLVGQIGANYATIKGRQVGLTDEALQQQIISGDFDTANDPTGTKFKQALLEATVRKISTLTPQAYASQEATSMTAITEALNQNLLTPNDQDLVISFSRQVETNDTIKQLVPAASRRFHADINARNGLASTTPQAPQPVTINFTVSPPAPVAGPTPAPILTPATDALSQVNTSGGWTNPQLSDQLVYKLYEHAADPALASDPDAPQLRTEAEAELKRRGILPP